MVGSVVGRPAADEMIVAISRQRVAVEPFHEPRQRGEHSSETSEIESKARLEKAVSYANDLLQRSAQTYLKFELHEQLNQFYVKVLNQETDEVLREIPPKKLLDIFAAMASSLGLIVDKKL